MGPLVEDYLDSQYEVLVAGELALREGRLDVVHPTRVASRRYRTVLRDMHDLFEPAAGMILEESLRWYAGVLGAIRDIQIAREELVAATRQLPPELLVGPVDDVITRYLAGRERHAVAALGAAFDSHRYQVMMGQLRSWHDRLPLEADPPRTEVKQYLKRANRRVDRRIDAATEQGNPDELVHDARKAAKRARYVAELAQPVLGGKARTTVKRMTSIQDRLGADQDNATSRSLLLAMATADLGESSVAGPLERSDVDQVRFTLGVLYASMSLAADEHGSKRVTV